MKNKFTGSSQRLSSLQELQRSPQYFYLNSMQNSKPTPQNFYLSMKAITWQKDSHSLFDYEFNKNVVQNTFDFPLEAKFIYIFRNNTTCQITFDEKDQLAPNQKPFRQLLGCVQVKEDNKGHKLQFYNASFIRQKAQPGTARTNSSNDHIDVKEEDIYLIVRSLKNKNNQNKGYKLRNGQIVKLGRVQYLITSANAQENNCESKARFWANTKRIVVQDPQGVDLSKQECKYCYMGQDEEKGGFLCSPCKCSGSCGLVHFRCLEKWNQSKVKKEAVGGAIQYNFQKFYCEVCKDEYPRYIQKDTIQYELLPIQKPQGDHLMLQGISQKANNMMVIQQIAGEGVKLGRGHQCQIRITDISVSRSHARIEKKGEDYFIFDNRSKFGTLVKENRLQLDLDSIKQGIQIGRTVITFQKGKKV